MLLRPDVELKDMIRVLPKLKEALGSFDDEFIEQASIQVKYDVYIEKEKNWCNE